MPARRYRPGTRILPLQASTHTHSQTTIDRLENIFSTQPEMLMLIIMRLLVYTGFSGTTKNTNELQPKERKFGQPRPGSCVVSSVLGTANKKKTPQLFQRNVSLEERNLKREA